MAAPKTVTWEAEPHTLAKHAVLQHYLEAWFPILARYHDRLVYLDGFAGPGRYSKGEDGSPIIALKVAANHRAQLRSKLVFVFVEEDEARATWLRDHEIPALTLPANFEPRVYHEQFEPILRRTLDEIDSRGLQMAPTFAFIDPFGISGLPFSLIKRLLSRQRCEVFITFMTSAVQRFVTLLPEHVNALIGDPDAAAAIAASRDRVVTARVLYERSLRGVARFVRFFQMSDTNHQPIYDLFFATKNEKGHEKMKEAMWKVDASGAYSFCDGADPNQATLFSPTPGADFARPLWRHFHGRAVYAEEVYRFAQDTAYLEKHARDALRTLESNAPPVPERIEVEPLKRDGTKRRPDSFPNGTFIRFVA